jgi:nickel/cobalt transporter (NicO) family protein
MRPLVFALLLLAEWIRPAQAHDIPNAQVDRSIQVTVRPGGLLIAYEITLSELTLTQDLRSLIGTLPGADRRDWFNEYGRIGGPLNAKGLLVSVNGRPLILRSRGFDLSVEDHVRYTFHFESDLLSRGRMAVRDTNYASGEGMSRLAVRGMGGVVIRGDDLPSDVTTIQNRRAWQLTDAEERRTRQLEVDFESEGGTTAEAPAIPPALDVQRPSRSGRSAEGLSQLLDSSSVSRLGLWLIALTLGAAHAIQPGHGKTLVAAASVSGRRGWQRGGIVLTLVITLAHMSGVLAIAAALWVTRSSRYPDINLALARTAGFVIAAIGLWRLGRHLAGYGDHDQKSEAAPTDLGLRELIGLGLAGGLVPCWDAVVLILLAEAVGRLALGLALLTAFSLGMACVLVTVGVMAAELQRLIKNRDAEGVWAHWLGLFSASAITAIGLYLFL